MSTSYVSTSIAYPNAKPHIGYALELVQADFLARTMRMRGEATYFTTGIDEHGIKIQRAAEKAGQTPLEFVDAMALHFTELAERLTTSYDRFIRTTDGDHLLMAQALWRRCLAAGDIEKRRYQAWYDVKEEEFLGLVSEFPDKQVFANERDIQNVELIDEENYFFCLSRYADKVRQLIADDVYKVMPAFRKNELLNVLDTQGLRDISISREVAKLSWGLPVPDDEGQVMYVWFDALTNYLTASASVDELGEIVLTDAWPATVHCVGKDITRFHAFIWPAMLLSAGLPLPKELLVHGFLTSGGQKMSKSIGNVVNPIECIDRTGSEAVRWFLLKEVGTTADSDFTLERLEQVYSADLANNLGNLVSRVWKMVHNYSEGKVPTAPAVATDYSAQIAEYWKQVDARSFHVALQLPHQLLEAANRLVDAEKPWVLAKDPVSAEKLQDLLYQLLEMIFQALNLMEPAIPLTVQKARAILFPSGTLTSGEVLSQEQPMLFPRLS
jgi:methionyl-tRNA synthetase